MARVDEVINWRFSVDWAVDDLPADVYGWTAPAVARCGDLAVLYEGGRRNRQAFVAIGRLCTDAIRAEKGDHRHWAYVEWQPLRRPVPLSEVRQEIGYANVDGSYKRVSDPTLFTRLWSRLIDGDRAARAVAGVWARGEGYPRTDQVPLRELVEAKWRYQPTLETAMYEPTRSALLEKGWKEVSAPVQAVAAKLADEETGGRLLPDILLERPKRGRGRQVLVVEVKRRARHGADDPYDPVNQALNYAAALRRGLRSADVSCMVVAYDVAPAEKAHAASEGVAVRILRKDGTLADA